MRWENLKFIVSKEEFNLIQLSDPLSTWKLFFDWFRIYFDVLSLQAVIRITNFGFLNHDSTCS